MTFIICDDVANPCECRSVREAERILKVSGVSDAFRKKTFDSFDFSRSIECMEAFNKANEYAKSFDKKGSIMFLGQVGSGKTHLCMAIANKLMDNGVGVVYMNYRDAIMGLKQNIMDEVYYQKQIGRLKNCKVLFIDDLFKGRLTESDINVVYEIINFRYFKGLPVIVSCEKGTDEILKIDEAIGSRLLEMCGDSVVVMKGKRLNYRIYRNMV